jgi:NADH-quinone oxidoreductase subunit H
MDAMNFVESVIKIFVVMFLVLLPLAAILVWLERRISAFIQNRHGPNRVGPFGLLQPIADVLKLLGKEDIVPKAANRFVHDLAPMISITVALSTFAVIPVGNTIEIAGRTVKLMIADVNVGVLYILAMTGMGVYGITLAGWSSNSKYSLLGGLRSSAQLISYELSMGLSLIGVIIVAGTVRLDQIVLWQSNHVWNILLQPIGFIIFLVASFAETNRLPFDLPEAEPELVGGYHTEYTGMKFGLFFLSEYANMTVSSALIATLFLGGWHIPFADKIGFSPFVLSLLQVAAFAFKMSCMLLFYIVVRWTLPRFRYDQLMNLGWKVLLPLSIVNVLVTGIALLIWNA